MQGFMILDGIASTATHKDDGMTLLAPGTAVGLHLWDYKAVDWEVMTNQAFVV